MDVQTRNENTDIISPQHFEHQVWMNELKFFNDEVAIYERQLEKMIQKDNKDMLPSLEQLQNNFIRQKEVLDHLNHDIKVHEQKLAWTYLNDELVQNKFIKKHESIRENMETFKRLFAELKDKFYAFMLKYQ